MKRKLSTREAAKYLSENHGLPIAARTLDNYAWSGRGPLHFKAAGRRLYDPDHLDAWAEQTLGQPRASTSAAAVDVLELRATKAKHNRTTHRMK